MGCPDLPSVHTRRQHQTSGRSLGGLTLACATLVLAGCGEDPVPARAPSPVRTQAAVVTKYASSVTLTGEIRARVQSDLGFRFAGRVATRSVDVGDKVGAGQVLARLVTTEQNADLVVATAGVQAAEATLRQTTNNCERQRALFADGFATRTAFDNANQANIAAQASVDGAKATLAVAEDRLANTSLRSDAAGVVTARYVEAGQVVEEAQAMFTIAADGGRDAVFDVPESLLTGQRTDDSVQVTLLSNPVVTAAGKVREISPTIDPSTGTVRVKVGLDQPPPDMGLGAPVAGAGHFNLREVVAIPWTALSTQNGRPAVWVVDPRSKAVSLRPVVIDSYHTGETLLRDGLKPGDLVVTAGMQLLRPGQIVASAPQAAPAEPPAPVATR